MADQFDVAIIGAGPSGLGAAVNASAHKVSHILIEKGELGNTIFDYQLGKLVMAEPARLPLRGTLPFQVGSREEILEGWKNAATASGINLRKAEVKRIKKTESGFEIDSSTGPCTAKQIILCIGVQGTPRRLGVPGEELSHVAYTLADPGAFKGRDILIVGAGDAAIENALGLCDKNRVSLLNRSAEFPRAKEANVAKITDAVRNGKVRLFANSSVARVEPETTYINSPDGEVALKCDHIIARLGGILPRKFLEDCGIQFPSADTAAVPVVSNRYESNVPGLFVLGALIGYPLIKHAINQGFEVIEHILGNSVEPADQVLLDEKLRVLSGASNDNLAMIRAQLPFLKDLSDSQFRELIIESTIHVVKSGEKIFERNDYTDTFFSVVKGNVLAEVPDRSPVSIGAGQFFGEMGLLSGRRRSVTVRAGGAGVLLETPRKQMLKLISSVQSVKKTIDETFVLRALSTSIFPDADPAFLATLVSKVKTKNFKKGDVLFKEGDPGDILYVIRKGSVKVSRRNREGADVAQTYIPAGHIVGEMSLLSAETKGRSATVSAAVPCESIMIEKSDFLELLEANPDVKKRIQKLASARALENVTLTMDSSTGKLLDFVIAQGVTDADNFLLIDSDLCVGCDNCESACAATHRGFSRLDRKGGKTFASVQIPISCRHCENPLCMLDCPPDALVRQPNGEVMIRDSCIGCGNCVRNCPYGVIQLVHDDESGFSLWSLLTGSKKKEHGAAKAAKCDMCSHLNSGPACVRSCPTGAIVRINPNRLVQILSEKQSA